jgi:CSLREA domain-containing protein
MVKIHQQDVITVRWMLVAGFTVALLSMASVDARVFTVNHHSDFDDVNPGDGICNVNVVGPPICTLRAAVQEANTTIVSDTIRFDCDNIGGPIVVGNEEKDEIEIEESVVIRGTPHMSCPIIDGGTVASGSEDSIFEINNGVVKLQYLILINGRDIRGSGGCLDSEQSADLVDIKGVEFWNCEAPIGRGGAIGIEVDALFVTRSLFHGNAANDNGGAINGAGVNSMWVSKSTFKENISGRDGGAIVVHDGGNLMVSHSRFLGNTAAGEGGALKNASSGTVIIIDNVFRDNIADEGGAMCDDGNGSFATLGNIDLGGNLGTADFTGLQNFFCLPD